MAQTNRARPLGASQGSRAAPSRTRAAGAAAVLASALLAGCQPAVLDPEGPIGQAQKTILIDSLIIMLAIVVPTILGSMGVAWWFRAGNRRAKYLPHWAYSGQIEVVTWGIPLLTITLLGGVAWIGSHQLDPAQPIASNTKPLEVQVVSLDWKWLFIYPAQNVASVNQLAIPAGTPVHFTLTSASVLNAFFIPQLGSMIYTMNGMASQLWLQADHVGTYAGLSSHYSGDGFSDMHFQVHSLDPAGFEAWIAAARTRPPLDAAGYTELTKPSMRVPPGTFGGLDASLFDKIVSQQLPPGPGPAPQPHPTAPQPGAHANRTEH